MKLKILLGALLLLLFTADVSNAQHYRHGGYRRHGYYRRGPVVVVAPPRPVIVRHGYYGRGYRRGYYGRPGYRRGYYNHHRGYYGHVRHHRHGGRW